ncbi:methyltransferase, FkbM family [Rhodovulum sp. ES.010]|uniref:FkbM family methyltransferase n=1 Tax=Rhodovulum sp. ES.010 TaxID=1882821 RepID=UPI00092C0772|nr:FkbM family methyltransferase [Rhodovulum sp. ES.010]SIO50490.1 methyltransferase, FkbM family [Rhodovulum sp. ES.010]
MPKATGAAARHRRPHAAAIGRSLDIYYRDTDRTARMDRLHAAFVTPGAPVFDIGAHVGDRTGSFLRHGASVVALEPQPQVFRALRLIHGRHPAAVLLPAAAGAAPGTLTLHLNTRNPTVSTVAPGFLSAAADAPGWRDEVWDGTVTVPVVTLDLLIARHGLPAFVKIDVEGHEPAVLQGLSAPLPALSFEFTTIQRRAAHACIARLGALGRYAYNLSLGEEHRLRHDVWLTAAEMQAELDALPETANSGDVYARRV